MPPCSPSHPLPSAERLPLARAWASVCPNDICRHQVFTPCSGCDTALPERQGNSVGPGLWQPLGSFFHPPASLLCHTAPLPLSSDTRKPELCCLCLPTPRFTDCRVSLFCCLAVYGTGTCMNSRKQWMNCALAHISACSLALHSESSQPGAEDPTKTIKILNHGPDTLGRISP